MGLLIYIIPSDGCYVDTPNDAVLYHGYLDFSDDEKLDETGYSTIHKGETVTITCQDTTNKRITNIWI